MESSFNPFSWPYSATYAYFTVVLCVKSTSLHMWVVQHFWPPHNVLFFGSFQDPLPNLKLDIISTCSLDSVFFFSVSGKIYLSDQFFSTIAVLFRISNWAYGRVGYMSWERILLFFLNSIWSLLLWQLLFKGRLLVFIDSIRNRKFQYSWSLCYILLCQGNQKVNWKSKEINWTSRLYQQEKVKISWSLKMIFLKTLTNHFFSIF